MKTKILADFKNCISVPLRKSTIFLNGLTHLFLKFFKDMPLIKLEINILIIFSQVFFHLNVAIPCKFKKKLFRCTEFHPITFQMHTTPPCSSNQSPCSNLLQSLLLYQMTSQEMNTHNIWCYYQGYNICHHHSPILLRLIVCPVHLTIPHLV